MAIEVISEIVPKNNGKFSIVDTNNVRGGLHSVNNVEDLTNIPDSNKKEGMMVYVKNGTTHWYQLINNNWQIFKFDQPNASGFYVVQSVSDLEYYKKTGYVVYVKDMANTYLYDGTDWIIFGNSDAVPVYTQTTINKKGEHNLPKQYISVPDDDTDLQQQPKNTTFTLSKDSSYVDILMSSLRALQMEVAKIKNTFKYGMESYTGTQTAMSTITGEIQEPEDEPLWAVDQSSLSEIVEVMATSDLTLADGSSMNVDASNKFTITGTATWTNDLFNSIIDNQIFLYFTSTNSNIKIYSPSSDLYLDLSKIGAKTMQNIMVCINRPTVIDNKSNGTPYIYITIDDYYTGNNIVRGYLGTDYILHNQVQDLSQQYNKNNNLFNLGKIEFKDISFTKAIVYSKYQSFSNGVIPQKANDYDYKYKVSHITIRAVDNYNTLKSIADQLPENELIYVKALRRLYIKSDYTLQAIGGGTTNIPSTDSGMTQEEMLAKLKELGIVTMDNGELELSNLQDIIFINNETGKKYKLSVNPYGEIITKEVSNDTLAERTKSYTFSNDIRGFIGQYRLAEYNSDLKNAAFNRTSNIGLYSDRLQIAAIYNPLPTDTVYGCTHSYIELQNTANVDFPLTGCYLHMAHTVGNNVVVEHLALNGAIPAGGTYLVRGKKWAEPTDTNVFINVDQYDQEWYTDVKLDNGTVTKRLLDWTWSNPIGFALTYGNADLKYDSYLVKNISADETKALNVSKSSAPYVYDKSFIDAIYYGSAYKDTGGAGYWASSAAIPVLSNAISRNTFELEPAQQGFQSLSKYDSSRNRWGTASDYSEVSLNKEYIEFPFSDKKCPVSRFAPKASFQHKTVCSDKTQLDLNKPNTIQLSFGKNIYTTRCFNWISAGLFDEYVFIKSGNTWKAFESYKKGATYDTSSYPQKVQFNENVQDTVYNRFMIRFPANKTLCTSHKCIIKLVENSVTEPTTYTYRVGRALKNGQPDLEHCSEERTFTLYPESYTPRIYQITDQQGFHWIEYQVWAAAAKKVNERILADQSAGQIIPILINTGDVTQNGTRVNEWLDYYIAGDCLFNHLECMNVVGNNDLCSTVPTDLGTGDDIGKSNSYYFHIFNCYEIDTENLPIVNDKYVPSLYYFETATERFVMVNSEITYENCTNWFNLKTSDGQQTVNIYTGWSIPKSSSQTQVYYTSDTFTPLYNKIYNMTTTTKKLIVCCHESPFTVITNDSISTDSEVVGNIQTNSISRSISNKGALIGSHLNQICPEDNAKGIYWFSRLMEDKKAWIVICGHKHTYTCTYPVREYYKYTENNIEKNSLDNGPMKMPISLQNDTAVFVWDSIDHSKFPLTKRGDQGTPSAAIFYPYTSVLELSGGITYFMCQATGYKLTSNKELPSAYQKFSEVLPQTIRNKNKDTASPEQKYPMFAIIDVNDKTVSIKLIRIKNIFKNNVFTQQTYSTEAPTFQYLGNIAEDNNYGVWGDTESTLLTITIKE